MGTYKFTWAHPAEEVYVTGTFDNWTKSEKLEKVGSSFEKTVTLADASEKIYYKFVVDNNWITDHTAPQEPDHEGNVNNFLTPDQIVKENTTAAVMNTVTPESTTAALAKDVPLENKEELPQATPSDIPGGFPVTPANELDKFIGVNPIPAQDVTAEPVTVAPGEPLPASVKAGDINEHVKLDKEGYEDSSALPGLSKEETTIPDVTSNTIPESSLPIATADATINSAAPASTTAALAAEVPLETKTAEVPEVVKESQEKAHADPEASANPEAVQEKAVVEDELLEKVPTAPSTSEGTAGFGTQKTEAAGVVVATAATVGGLAAAAAINAKDTVVEAAAPHVEQATVAATDAAAQLPEPVKESLPVSVQEAIGGQTKEETREEVAPEVPTVVKESIAEAGKSPEAAANTEAVIEKKEVEAELLKEVKPVPAVGEETKVEAEKPKVEAAKEEVKETKEEVKEGEKTKTEAVKEEAKLAKEEVKAAVTKDDSTKEANGANGVHTTANGANGASLTSTKEPEVPTTPAKAPSSVPESTTPSNTKATESPSGTEKKKKNRLSAFIGKLKSKVHSK
ncbi:hypothetical protein COL5a_011183 [Colletotrichum fioriniae]|nr:uncharacterized protein COL516b_007909 [Colletotrichum fioriniae]KAJ0301136.1 hypothetical protein COL516b_007909 [Colletotrichum fioriniae]KAJ0317353.1 hypothetical protein COL5a_011183 [Colletotrichum fioriniae]